VLLTLSLLLFSSCGSKAAAPSRVVSPGTEDPQAVTVVFDNGQQGGHRRFLAIENLRISEEAPPHYDLQLASDRPAGMWLSANGTRNLAVVGTGDEAAFRALLAALAPWNIEKLPAAAEGAGIVPGARRANYWTPGDHIVPQGTILALRVPDPAPAGVGGVRPPDIAALVYVQSISGKEEMVLLVSRGPQARAP
jgi:hypothetical protein